MGKKRIAQQRPEVPEGFVSIARIAVELPGVEAIAGELIHDPNEPVNLDEFAIELHALVNEMIFALRDLTLKSQ